MDVLTTPVGMLEVYDGSLPYFDLSIPPPGNTSVEYPFTANTGVLNALIASNRNSSDWRSVIANFLDKLISSCLIPGPRSVEMPQDPNFPGPGSDIVVGSNQTYPPPAKFLNGVATEGESQFGRGWKY